MKLKTVDIKGKAYVPVNARMMYFRTHEEFKGYSLDSEIIELTATSVTIKAIVRNVEGRIIASGLANENKNDGYINKTSFIENCETSAWGRALSNLGIGIDTSIASYDEVFTAQAKQAAPTKPKPKPKPLSQKPVVKVKPILTSKNEANWAKGLEYAKKNGIEKLLSFYNLSESDLKLMGNAIK
jgi:hypothetical protein